MATAKKKTAASASTKASKAPGSVTLHGITPYQPKANEEYMNDLQRAHFKLILNAWRNELMEEVAAAATTGNAKGLDYYNSRGKNRDIQTQLKQ